MKTYHILFLTMVIAITARTHAQALQLIKHQGHSYASFADAVTAIGSAKETLIVSSNAVVSTAVNVPSTLHVRVIGSGQFTKSGSGAITFNGPFEAPLRQVFSGFAAGEIRLGSGAVNEAYPQWWGAKGNGASDDTSAIQAAIDSCNRVVVPPGQYKITSTLLVNNRMGFRLTGAGIKTTSMVAGTPKMVLFRVRNSMYSSFSDIFLNGNSIATSALVLDQISPGATYVTNTDTFDRMWFGYAAGTTVVIGDDNNGQVDNITFNECIFSNSPTLVQVRGQVTLGIRFNGGSLNYPTIAGFDLIRGGEVSISKMHFLGGFKDPAKSCPMLRRAGTFGHVTMTENEMEGAGTFLFAPDDTGFANTWPIELIGNTIGYIGPAGSNVIDYRQRGPLIIIGGTSTAPTRRISFTILRGMRCFTTWVFVTSGSR